MTPRELDEALALHKRKGMFHKPLQGVRVIERLTHPMFQQWVGEQPDRQRLLVRSASHAEAVELLLNEAEVAGKIAHRNLAPLAWTMRPQARLLTLGFRWPEARSLRWPVDLRWLLRCFIAAARGVAAMHAAGLVHADLKPDAICFTEDPDDVKVWGFQVAQPPGPPKVGAWSARFAAPEQVTGAPLDFTADVYALGVSLYSMFIRSRFPAIRLADQPKTMGPATGPVMEPPGGAYLSAATHVAPTPDQAGIPVSSGQSDTHAILGAKLLFARQMEEVAERTANIGAAHELLVLIDKASAQKPADRFPDAARFAEALEALL